MTDAESVDALDAAVNTPFAPLLAGPATMRYL